MKIKQIRNATIVLDYDDQRILIDPFLGDKGSYDPFPSLVGNEKNPIIDLPVSIDSIIKDIDLVIVTHTHIDHWDPKAAEVLNKDLPFVVQNEADAKVIREDGFKDVTILENNMTFEGITLTKTPGQHYVDLETKKFMDGASGVTEAMGIIFSAEKEATLYLAGDTIWYTGVKETLATYQPEIIILNAGGNQFAMDNDDSDSGRLLMNEKEVFKVHQAAPNAKIVASHMEAVNHWYTTRDDLKMIAKNNNFEKLLFVPEDGETVEF